MDDVSVAEKVPLLAVNGDYQQANLAAVNGDSAKANGVNVDEKKKEEDGDNDKDKDKDKEKEDGDGDANEDDEDKKKKEDIRIRTQDVGVWRIFYQDQPWSFLPGVELFRKFKGMAESLPSLWRFTMEVWSIAPGYLLLWWFIKVWESIDGAISLWITATLLNTVSRNAMFTSLVSMRILTILIHTCRCKPSF